MLDPESDRSLVLLPEVEARAALAGRSLRLRVLVPPYPAIGLGVLRVLRVARRSGYTELMAGYEGYARADAVARREAT